MSCFFKKHFFIYVNDNCEMEKSYCDDYKFTAEKKKGAPRMKEKEQAVFVVGNFKRIVVYVSHAYAYKTSYFFILRFEVSTSSQPKRSTYYDCAIYDRTFRVIVSLWCIRCRHFRGKKRKNGPRKSDGTSFPDLFLSLCTVFNYDYDQRNFASS